MNSALVGAFLTCRFLLELAMLAAVGYWGATRPVAPVLQIVIAAAAVIVTATVWGVFVSPKARVRLHENGRLTVELCVVLAAVLAMRDARRPQLALALGAAAVAVAVVNSFLRRSSESGETADG